MSTANDCGGALNCARRRCRRESSLGQKRKWRRFQVMSALPHKADIDARDCDVRFVPIPDLALNAQNVADHTITAGWIS